MNIQGFFTTEDLDIYDIAGNLKGTEPIHLTRQGIANNDFAHTHKFKGLLITKTALNTGDLCITKDNKKYLVTAMRKIMFLQTNQANLWLCDNSCSIIRLQDKFVGKNKVGTEEIIIKENIPCIQKDTNGKIQTFDAGLLEGTTKLVYMQYHEDIVLTDRLLINGKRYQINSLDRSIENVLCIQLTEDKRK